MKTHYFVRALVRDRESKEVQDKTFDVWAWSDWQPAWSQQHGGDWTLVEVLEVREALPDEVLA